MLLKFCKIRLGIKVLFRVTFTRGSFFVLTLEIFLAIVKTSNESTRLLVYVSSAVLFYKDTVLYLSCLK